MRYSYDAAGNRIKTIENGVITNYTTNNLNQYKKVGTATHTYDLDGNLIKVVDGANVTTYTYNDENRLIKAVTATGTFEYEYDAFGNRTAVIENGQRKQYLIDPFGLGDVVGEYNATGGLIANYVHGLGLVGQFNGANGSYYDSDLLGSTMGMTGTNGSYVNRYVYRPFGGDLLKTEGVGNSFEYVGQWGVMDDLSGLDYMRARFYSPSAGRFMNPDPIRQAGGFNIYAYVLNNPTNFIDSSGLAYRATNPLEALGPFGKTLSNVKFPGQDGLNYEFSHEHIMFEKEQVINHPVKIDGTNKWLPKGSKVSNIGFSPEGLFTIQDPKKLAILKNNPRPKPYNSVDDRKVADAINRFSPEDLKYNLLTNNCQYFVEDIWNDAQSNKNKPNNTSSRTPADYPSSAAGNAATRVLFDPLVLDLDGDGVELISITQSTASFDLDADDFREQTGWVKADDGMLTLDANGDGKINDIRELFGDALTDGFDELKTLDSNNDNIINASDAQFGQLKIWRDLNQDGITDTGELKTLAQLNIASISLATTQSGVTNEGNLIRSVGKYTRTNGIQRDAVSLWFAADLLNTSYDEPFELKAETLFLPTTRGYGKLPDLYIAASLDSQLLGLLRDFAVLTINDMSQVIPKIEAILFRWAGVDTVDPSSRDQFFDARKLGFLEAFLNQPIQVQFGVPVQTIFIQQAWDLIFKEISSRLVVQGTMRDLFPNTTYLLNSDSFSTTDNLSEILDRLSANVPTDFIDAARYWSYAIAALDGHGDNFGLTETDYSDLIRTALSTSGLSDYLDALRNPMFGGSANDFLFSQGAAIIEGFAGNDTINTLNTFSGNDIINSGDGDDTINSGIGNDTVNTGAGNDTVSGGVGDNLNGGVGIDALNLYLTDQTSNLSIINYANTGINLPSLISAVNFENFGISTGSGNDTITQTGIVNGVVLRGNDNIYSGEGNDTINAGLGSDVVDGGGGDDLLILDYSVGDTGGGVSFGYYGYNYGIYASRYDTNSNLIDYLQFSEIERFNITGTNQADSINTFSGNDTINSGNGDDTIYTGDGNDTVNAGAGNDTVFGGSGNDRLTGGSGNDTLTGDLGADRFTFTSPTQGIDSITDFSVVDDSIAVSAAGFGGGLIANTAITAATIRNWFCCDKC